MLQHIGIPGIVADCNSCQAVVFIRGSSNPILEIALELSTYALIIVLILWSFNVFGVMWPSVPIFITLYFGRLYIKARQKLDYVR